MIKMDLEGAKSLGSPRGNPPLEKELRKVIETSGFANVARSEHLLERLKDRADEIRDHFQRTIIIGIGGSAWTPISINDFFQFESTHQLCFLDGPDAFMFRQVMGSYQDLKKSHFVFVSKTGSTLETLSLLQAISKHLMDSGFDLKNQSTVICGLEENPLLSWATQRDIPAFEIPQDVGGRYSALTPVGLLATALLGRDPQSILNGAKWALDNESFICDLACFMLVAFQKELYVTQMWVYSQRLWALGNWWQQLWSESLSKKTTLSGQPAPRVSTPMVCCGPRDQHSLFQQLIEGYPDKSVVVLSDSSKMSAPVLLSREFERREEFSDPSLSLSHILRSELEGFCGALSERGVPFVRLRADFSKEESWGAFFMAWQLAVALVGKVLDINPFDQPGVELGKELAKSYLKSVPKNPG